MTLVFAVSTATAAYFVVGNIESAGAPAALKPITETVPPSPPQLVTQESQSATQRPVRGAQIDEPESGNNGGPVADRGQLKGQPATVTEPHCDRRACSRAYRSFDETTCTYQPNRGPRRLCEK